MSSPAILPPAGGPIDSPQCNPNPTSTPQAENVAPQNASHDVEMEGSSARKRPAPEGSALFGSPNKRASASSRGLVCKKLSDKASLPARGSASAAGYDLCSAQDCVIPAKGRALVKTDIAVAVPPGTYGRVAPRSGLALKHGIDVGAGVVDADYRGNVGVILFNLGDAEFKVSVGDRIAQLILECIVTPDVVEADELPSTERGVGGFGSTGVSSSLIQATGPC